MPPAKLIPQNENRTLSCSSNWSNTVILKCEREHKHCNKLQKATGTYNSITEDDQIRFFFQYGTCTSTLSLLSINCNVQTSWSHHRQCRMYDQLGYFTIVHCQEYHARTAKWLNIIWGWKSPASKCSLNQPCKGIQNPNVPDCVAMSYLLPSRSFFITSFHVIKSINLKKGDIWVQISSLYGHYLLIFMFIPAATKSCHLDVLWKQMARHSILNYTFPYLLEKQVLEITRKVIFTVACGSVMCPAKSRLRWAKELLRVGKGDETVSQTRSKKAFHIHIRTSIYITVPKDI